MLGLSLGKVGEGGPEMAAMAERVFSVSRRRHGRYSGTVVWMNFWTSCSAASVVSKNQISAVTLLTKNLSCLPSAHNPAFTVRPPSPLPASFPGALSPQPPFCSSPCPFSSAPEFSQPSKAQTPSCVCLCPCPWPQCHFPSPSHSPPPPRLRPLPGELPAPHPANSCSDATSSPRSSTLPGKFYQPLHSRLLACVWAPEVTGCVLSLQPPYFFAQFTFLNRRWDLFHTTLFGT